MWWRALRESGSIARIVPRQRASPTLQTLTLERSLGVYDTFRLHRTPLPARKTPTTRSDLLKTDVSNTGLAGAMVRHKRRADVYVDWFETDILAEERNYRGLTRLNADRFNTRLHNRIADA
jgi:hypothetical protein